MVKRPDQSSAPVSNYLPARTGLLDPLPESSRDPEAKQRSYSGQPDCRCLRGRAMVSHVQPSLHPTCRASHPVVPLHPEHLVRTESLQSTVCERQEHAERDAARYGGRAGVALPSRPRRLFRHDPAAAPRRGGPRESSRERHEGKEHASPRPRRSQQG